MTEIVLKKFGHPNCLKCKTPAILRLWDNATDGDPWNFDQCFKIICPTCGEEEEVKP